MRWDFFRPGSVIIRKGDTFSSFYLIKKGLVSVSISQKIGRPRSARYPKESVSVKCLSFGGVTTANVTAVKETLCLRQGQIEFVKDEEHPAVQRFFTALVIERMRGVYNRLLADAPEERRAPCCQTAPLRVMPSGAGDIETGRAARFRRKAQKKPLALLEALIALGGRQVSEEALTGLIWPDADGGAAHDVFRTTLVAFVAFSQKKPPLRCGRGK